MCTHNDGNFVIQDYEENAKKKKKKISKNFNEAVIVLCEI